MLAWQKSIQTLTARKPAAPHATVAVNEKYKTSIYKQGDKTIIASLNLSVLSSLGVPYATTPVVLFSDPKIAVTNEQGVATFHEVETGKHRLEIHVEGEKVETRDIILEPPSGLTLEERQRVDVVLPVVQVLVEKPSANTVSISIANFALGIIGILAVNGTLLYIFVLRKRNAHGHMIG